MTPPPPDLYQHYVWAAYGVALALYGGLILSWHWRCRHDERKLRQLSASDEEVAS
ncbi:MAG: heme exporter protein CcmD [Magnetococcales bacterium]|nr:heme exporter protein CcmD [Magnetococcales bacterium]